jgi:tetratricopeptide (TPR) repeat protein
MKAHSPRPTHTRLVAWAVMLLFAFHASAADAPPEFSEANAAYLAGDFEKARTLYDSIVEQGEYSAALFYNLGNAEFRLRNLGQAALNYRRALALQPGLAEAGANLRLVQDETAARIVPAHPTEKLFPTLPRHGWTLATAIAAWLSIFLVTALLAGHRRSAVWLATALAIVLCTYSATGLWRQHANRNLGVVVVPTAEARRSPTNTAKLAETLPAASEVSVLLDRGHWTYCVLPDGERAWLPSDSVVRVVFPEKT